MTEAEQVLIKRTKIEMTITTPDYLAMGGMTSNDFAPSVFQVGENDIHPAKINRHIVSLTDPFSMVAEGYKKLRAKIFQATKNNFQNTIMVTSALAGEGKTVTAINLAISIAQAIDHTVLLVDADLRQPSIHTYLGINPQYGLSDYLTSGMNLSDILIKTSIKKLVLLPAGTPQQDSSELMASIRMRELVYELKHRYRDRYIIFDSPPLLSTSDSLSLCEYMDGVLFIALAEHTNSKSAKQALALLKGCNILGIVFNGDRQNLSQNQYSAYYSF